MDDAIEENSEDYAKFLFNWYQAAIIMSVVWGLGGLLDINSREAFDAFYREVIHKNVLPSTGKNQIVLFGFEFYLKRFGH